MGLKILLFACRKTGIAAAKSILRCSRHTLAAVVTDDFEGQVNDGIKAAEYRRLSEMAGVPFYQTRNLADPIFLDAARSASLDVGLSIGWRRLVRDPILSIPKLGFYNFHTSDLPAYRGFASTSWAILRGETATAITAHKMISGVADEGDIFLKERIPISESDTIASLFKQIGEILPGMVLRFLDGLEDGTLKIESNTETDALLSFPRQPSDGWIDWNLSAITIDRLVRSVTHPYPGAFSCWRGRKVIIWRGHVRKDAPRFVGVPGHVVGTRDGESVDVLTGDGMYTVEEIELEESKPIPPATVIQGMQQRLGLTPGLLYQTLYEKSYPRDFE